MEEERFSWFALMRVYEKNIANIIILIDFPKKNREISIFYYKNKVYLWFVVLFLRFLNCYVI